MRPMHRWSIGSAASPATAARAAKAARACAAALACAAAVACAAHLAGCDSPQYEQRWERLHTGMTQGEVEALLGKPSSVHVPKKRSEGAEDASGPARGERWQYGDTLSSLATGAMFPDEADERAWIVFFGQDGKVTGYRAAGWTTGRRARDPQDTPTTERLPGP